MSYHGKFHQTKDSIRKIKVGDMISVPGFMQYEYFDKKDTSYMVTDVYSNFVICVDDSFNTLTLNYGDLVMLGYLNGGGFLDRECGIKSWKLIL